MQPVRTDRDECLYPLRRHTTVGVCRFKTEGEGVAMSRPVESFHRRLKSFDCRYNVGNIIVEYFYAAGNMRKENADSQVLTAN